jgi:hypothetical protein
MLSKIILTCEEKMKKTLWLSLMTVGCVLAVAACEKKKEEGAEGTTETVAEAPAETSSEASEKAETSHDVTTPAEETAVTETTTDAAAEPEATEAPASETAAS